VVPRPYLHRVDGNVNTAIKESLVDFLREESLAPNIGKSLAENLVARRLDDADLEGALLRKLREGLQMKK